MGPRGRPDGVPSPGDSVHVAGHGPATLVEIQSGQEMRRFLVQYPNGSQQLLLREEILMHEPGASANNFPRSRGSSGSPRGPRPLLYLGRPFSDPGRSIRTPSATFSLVATMVGGGVLSLPFAMSRSGLAVGTLALLLSGCASGWTLELLVECARSTGRDTFELVGHAAFGEFGRKITLTMVFVICWLSMIAYFVLIGDLLHPTAELVLPALKHIGSPETVRRVVLAVAALALSPMCFKNNLAALRFMCFASVGSVLLVTCIVTIRAAEDLGRAHDVQVKLADGSYQAVSIPFDIRWWPADWWEALYVFPMFGVSFLCHFNALPTHYELQRPTRYRMRRVVVLTIAFASFLYLCVGLFGYLYAGRCTCGNILLNFSASDKLVAMGRAALGLVLMLNFPLICQPCRTALFRVLSGAACARSAGQAQAQAGEELQAQPSSAPTGTQWVLTNEGGAGEGHSHPISPQGCSAAAAAAGERTCSGASTSSAARGRVHVYFREDTRGHMAQGTVLEPCDTFAPKDETVLQSAAEPSRCQTCTLTVVLLLSSLLISYFLKSILVVWSIIGSTVAFLVSFILPALFWYYIVGKAATTRKSKRWAALVLAVTSVVLAVACTILTIIHLNAPPCPVTAPASIIS
mmetsp:Transcript_25304/g.80429  ORF Transcript_25304/g.80429 Transcript_25304/m.80429 type:complete len:634 (+) Transcript_25304:81-1982(+)